jgi:putative ABC transport system substrate-binding protein
MKRTKNLVAAALILVCAVTVYAGGTKESGKRIIGISKIVSHPALDAIEKGIQDQLAADGFSDLSFDLQNANGDVNTAASIANKFIPFSVN